MRRRRGIDMTFRIIKHNFVGISRKYCGVGRILLEAIKTSGHRQKHILLKKSNKQLSTNHVGKASRLSLPTWAR